MSKSKKDAVGGHRGTPIGGRLFFTEADIDTPTGRRLLKSESVRRRRREGKRECLAQLCEYERHFMADMAELEADATQWWEDFADDEWRKYESCDDPQSEVPHRWPDDQHWYYDDWVWLDDVAEVING